MRAPPFALGALLLAFACCCGLGPPVAAAQAPAGVGTSSALDARGARYAASPPAIWMQSSNLGLAGRLPASHALFLAPLRERPGRHLNAGVSYRALATNLLPSLSVELIATQRIRRLQLVLNTEYVHSLVQDDRAMSLRLAAIQHWPCALGAGFEGRLSTDLERDEDEPLGEPELEGALGPLLSYALGHVSLLVHGGLRALRTRQATSSLWGAALGLSVAGSL
jgi:hypothetical protein